MNEDEDGILNDEDGILNDEDGILNDEDGILNDEDQWITEFNEEERKYGMFYKEPNTSISLKFIYINSKKEIEYITQSQYTLDKDNTLTASTLNHIISERKQGFRLYKLLVYNTTAEPLDIIEKQKTPTKLREITELSDILFEDTITFFKELNTLYFIFIEDTIILKQSQAQTPFSLNNGSRRKKRHL
jgi:hypothetical protein